MIFYRAATRLLMKNTMRDELQITSAAISDRGLSEKRPQNEDSYLELRDSGLFAVADGVGGAQAGDVASQMAMEILAEAFINLQEDGDVESRMRDAIERANSAIFQMSHDLPQLNSMATTVVALHLNGNVATIGHVGDSRLYRLDPAGDLYQETLDHSVVEEEVRAGRLTPEQAAIHPSRNVISRALGAEPLVDIDLKTMIVEPNTTFLACSDGVTRHIEDEELRSLLYNAPDADELCRTIKEICYERGAEDNLTAVVVRAEAVFTEEFVSADIPEDAEEETIATARAAGSQDEGSGNGAGSGHVADSPDLEASEQDTDEFEVDVEASPQARTDSISMSGSGDKGFLSILSEGGGSDGVETSSSLSSPDAGQASSGSVVGFIAKAFLGVVLLVFGVVVGAAGMYLWSGSTEPVAQVTPPVPEKVPLTTFEQAKSEVYKDPTAAIATLSANPRNSEDFYFLGLAYLLSERYEEATISLTKAAEALPEFEEEQRSILAREIAMARAVVDNPAAREAFKAGFEAASAPAAAAGVNSNTLP